MLRYVSYIDEETYAFIKAHRNGDLFLRTQPMLNWILQYSFTQVCPLRERTEQTTPFAPAKAESNHIYAVQVWDQNRLVGFYLMKHTEDDLHILYLYNVAEVRNKVYASIRDHAKRLNISQFVTDNADLANYMRKNIYFPKHQEVQIHFAYSTNFIISPEPTLQYGDGDNFTAE